MEFLWRAVISSLIVIAILSVVAFVPFARLSTHLVPNASPDLEHELRMAAYYCFAVYIVISFGQTFQGFVRFLSEIEYVNWCQLIGQLAGILSLLTLPHLFDSMLAFCFCVTLGTAASTVWFIIKGVSDFPLPNPINYSLRKSLPLFREGVGFLASSLSTLFYGGASLWVIALTFGTSQLATAAVMSRITQMYFSLLAVLLIPLAPALRNALATDDQSWVRRALRRAGAFMGGTALCAALGLVFLGNAIITRWTGVGLPALADWLFPLATLVLAITWSYFWIYACFGLRGSLPVAVLAVAEVIAISAQFYIFGQRLAPSSSLLIMAGTMMVFSGSVLPVIVMSDLRRLKRLNRDPVHSKFAVSARS